MNGANQIEIEALVLAAAMVGVPLLGGGSLSGAAVAHSATAAVVSFLEIIRGK